MKEKKSIQNSRQEYFSILYLSFLGDRKNKKVNKEEKTILCCTQKSFIQWRRR